MIIDFATLTPSQAYHAMIQTIIPRPIAWVLSDNGDGGFNLAPFSYFNGITGRPPLIMISIGRKPDGARKDTWANIDQRDDFVVHIAHREQAANMVASSATLPHGESEVAMLDLEIVAEPGFRLPRLAEARLAMFCRKHRIVEIGEGPQGLVLGEIAAMYVDDNVGAVRDGRLHVDPTKVDPVARLGGNDYTYFNGVVTIERPK